MCGGPFLREQNSEENFIEREEGWAGERGGGGGGGKGDGRERDTHTHTETQRERQTDTQTDRERDIQRGIQRETPATQLTLGSKRLWTDFLISIRFLYSTLSLDCSSRSYMAWLDTFWLVDLSSFSRKGRRPISALTLSVMLSRAVAKAPWLCFSFTMPGGICSHTSID